MGRLKTHNDKKPGKTPASEPLQKVRLTFKGPRRKKRWLRRNEPTVFEWFGKDEVDANVHHKYEFGKAYGYIYVTLPFDIPLKLLALMWGSKFGRALWLAVGTALGSAVTLLLIHVGLVSGC